jgi:hypothetical protein
MNKIFGITAGALTAVALTIWGIAAVGSTPQPEPTPQVVVQNAPISTSIDAVQAPAVDNATPLPEPPKKCPEGSQANAADATGDTSCYWEICFHLTLPDSTHPECNSDFKP